VESFVDDGVRLNELVNGGQLVPNVEGSPPAWIVPPVTDREPNPPNGYIVSFIRHHERGFAALASRFMRRLCHHYGVELHHFAPNAISQADTFVGVCEGFLGIPMNRDLWVYLFRAELHTLATAETRVRRAVRASGLSISLHREFYIPCTMTSNNAEWERGWFYLRNDGAGLHPYTDKVLKEKAKLLAPRHVSVLAAGVAGRASERVEGPGGRRAGGVFDPRDPSPLADRSPHGEGAPHLRDERGGQPYVVGAFAVAERSLPSGVRGHEGEARHQPQGRVAQQRRPLVVRYAPRHLGGE
jgi:hypothetical protein